MASEHFDRVYIRDLACRCIVGINDDERVNKQDITINIVLHADLRKACRSDNIADTVDYKGVKKNVLRAVEQSQFFLVERLAERVAEVCFEAPLVQRVEVTVDKPGALRFARSVAVHISRDREDAG